MKPSSIYGLRGFAVRPDEPRVLAFDPDPALFEEPPVFADTDPFEEPPLLFVAPELVAGARVVPLGAV